MPSRRGLRSPTVFASGEVIGWTESAPKCPLRKLLGIVVLLSCTSLVAAERDACQILIPSSLQLELERAHPDHRLPRENDETSSCKADRKKRNDNDCLLATQGDFDGNGQVDYVMVLPSRHGDAAPQFVAAFADASAWKVQPLRIGTAPVKELLVDRLPAGVYRETLAVLPEGVTGRTVTSKHDGVMLASCDSWMTGYFFIRDAWFMVALSD